MNDQNSDSGIGRSSNEGAESTSGTLLVTKLPCPAVELLSSPTVHAAKLNTSSKSKMGFRNFIDLFHLTLNSTTSIQCDPELSNLVEGWVCSFSLSAIALGHSFMRRFS